MRKIFVITFLFFLPVMSSAQSDSLKAVFTEICNILQTRSFSSDTEATRVFYDNNALLKNIKYSTRSVKIRVENGYLFLYFNDNGNEFDNPRYYQSGIYILKAPINTLRISRVKMSTIRFTCNNGMTLTHRGKSRYFTEYQITSEQSLSIMLLYKSLLSMQEYVIDENFMGELSHTISPSGDIRTAYDNVVKTLKDYKFMTEDTWYYGSTKAITLILQNGNFLFTFNDTGIPYDFKHSFGRNGIKTVKIPFSSATFYQPYNEGKLYLSSTNDDVEITWRGQKEIIKNYEIKGTELNIKKLQHELEILLTLAIEENFMGTLSGISTSHRKSTTKAKSSMQKKVTTQPQQRQRKRVPVGN